MPEIPNFPASIADAEQSVVLPFPQLERTGQRVGYTLNQAAVLYPGDTPGQNPEAGHALPPATPSAEYAGVQASNKNDEQGALSGTEQGHAQPVEEPTPAAAAGGGGDEPPKDPPEKTQGASENDDVPDRYIEAAQKTISAQAAEGTLPLESLDARTKRVHELAALLRDADEQRGQAKATHDTPEPVIQPEAEAVVLPFGRRSAGQEASADRYIDPTLPEPPQSDKPAARVIPVDRYIARSVAGKMLPGEHVSIPTGLTERTEITSSEMLPADAADVEAYRATLFTDNMSDASPSTTDVFGGEASALHPFRQVLTVDSGRAVALLQYSKMYPRTSFIGVDSRYDQQRQPRMDRPGVQLTQGSADALAGIANASMNTILVPNEASWIPDEVPLNTVVAELTRVAKTGTVLRTHIQHQNLQRAVSNVLQRHGWQVQGVLDNRQRLTGTFVAIKIPVPK
ncbi:MAG TPA: hypothetical protein VD735_06150 [Candidatus Saccharimonadales bacterium]|nr:hypothetical protein [Candidatus Saccharimonadales bacterium]